MKSANWFCSFHGLALAGVAWGLMAAASAANAGGVVINMPPPKKPVAKVVAAPVPATTSAPSGVPVLVTAAQPDVGDVALARYAAARTGPYDVYDTGARYAGIRSYSYGFPWIWGVPFDGCFGNQFFGFVGCPRPCTNVVIRSSMLRH